MYETLLAMNELWLQQGAALVISKIYASVSAMEADTAPVSDLTGQPLRSGQIVVIASSDSDNGSVYRYNGPDSPSWSLVGEIGNLLPVDSLDSDSISLPLAAHQGKVLDGKITELNQDVNGAEDTPYNPDAQWEFYLQNGAPTGWRGVSTNSYPMVADTRINKIIFPAIRASITGTIQYYIGYGDFPASSTSINPSNTTPIKSGTIEIETANQWLDNYTVNLDSEVVIPAGKKVYIFIYRYSGSCYFNGGGIDFNETEPYYDETDAFAYFITTNQEAPFEQNWSKASPNDTMRYRVCAPKLYLIIDGIEKEIKDDILEELENSDLIPTIVEETISNDEKVEVHLPDKLYAVVGDKLQIFYQGCIKADNLDCYDIEIACAKGKQLTRYYEYAPAASDVGSVSFTLYVKSNKENKILGQKTCTLITSAAPSSPQALKHVFCFGDSLTSGGFWPAEMKRRLVAVSTYDLIQGSGLSNIEFYGYMDRTVNGQNAHYYGVGGWTWKQYITKSTGGAFRFYVSGINQLSVDAVYSNNGHQYTIQEINVTGGDGNIRCLTSSNANIPSASGVLTKVSGEGDDTITFTSYEVENQNPLWDDANNKMSFIPYAQDCGASTIDAVYVLLTWNGMHPHEVFSVDDVTGHIADAKTFARTLHAEYPSAKLVIMGLQMPSITGGLGYNYGANGGYADKFGMKITALNYNKALQDLCNLDEFSPYCQFIGIAPQFDTRYNMPFNTVRVNARNGDITEPIGSNGVHPARPGYMQIADACYRHFVSEYCQ